MRRKGGKSGKSFTGKLFSNYILQSVVVAFGVKHSPDDEREESRRGAAATEQLNTMKDGW